MSLYAKIDDDKTKSVFRFVLPIELMLLKSWKRAGLKCHENKINAKQLLLL